MPAVESVERRDGGVVLHLAGELDLYNSADIAAALEEIAAESPARVVVDLSGVAFVDSTAMGTLVEGRRRVGPEAFVLAAPGADVARALEVSGLAQHFNVRPTVDAALHP